MPDAKPSIVEKSGSTRIEVRKINYFWIIHNFSFHDVSFKSPEFGENENFMWQISLSLRQNWFSLFLRLTSGHEIKTRIKAKVAILNKQGEETNGQGVEEPRSIKSNECLTFETFVAKDYLSNPTHELLTEDKLTVFCEIEYALDIYNVSDYWESMQFREPKCKLIENFRTLIDNKIYSDLTLVVGDRRISAHKAILSARSKVFAAMFEHDMKESKSNQIVFEDIDANVLMEVINFIYTGEVTNLETMAGDILAAADKYALEKLKSMCEKALYENLSVEVAATTLILADRYGAAQLKHATLNFIKLHASKIISTLEWQNMVATHSYLIADAFATLAKK